MRQPSQDGRPGILKAYAHPVASRAHLMLVDSDRERATLRQLLGVRHWLQARKGLTITLEKPLFDIAADPGDDAGEPCSRPPCIPDFVVRASDTSGRSTALVVETMGYADPRYRERKGRLHPLMAEVVGGPVVTHDFHLPARCSQDDRDAMMRKHVIARIMQAFG